MAARGRQTALPRAWLDLVRVAADEAVEDLRRVDDDVCRRTLPTVLDRLGLLVRDLGGLGVDGDAAGIGGSSPDALTTAEALARLRHVTARMADLDGELRKALAADPGSSGLAARYVHIRLDEIHAQLVAPLNAAIADLEDIRRHGYPLGHGRARGLAAPGSTTWVSRLRRADLGAQLGIGWARSRERHVAIPPGEVAPEAGTTVAGTRFVARLDAARAADLVIPARREPWALRAGTGPLALVDPAGGPDTIAAVGTRHTRWGRLRRVVRRKGEAAAVGQARGRLGDAATATATAAGMGGLALAGVPLAVAGLVGLSHVAVTHVVRALGDMPGPDDRRAWVSGTGHDRAALYQPRQPLHPAAHREQWQAELAALRDLGLAAVDARHAQAAGGEGVWLRARRSLYDEHHAAVQWCRVRQYPPTVHQLLLFDGGPEQLAEVLWQRVTA